MQQRMTSGVLLLLATLLASPPALAQEAEAAPVTVAVLGASVSAGFNAEAFTPGEMPQISRLVRTSLRLDTALRPLWPESRVRLRSYADAGLFQNRPAGLRQISRALRRKPAAILALDLPFWFGAGDRPTFSDATEVEERLALQAQLLEALEEVKVPILLGDYPDISDASSDMVPARLKPSKEALVALNRNLRAWAAERQNVRVVPLARWVKWARKEGLTLPVNAARAVHLGEDELLTWDHLHPTGLGMAALCHWLQPALAETFGEIDALAFKPRALEAFLGPTLAWELLPKPPKEEPAALDG